MSHPSLSVSAMLLLASAAAVQKVAAGNPTPPTIADDPGEQIPGPANPGDPASVSAWRSAMQGWRSKIRAKIDYNGSIYSVPELQWTQTSYIQPQMHPYDRFFFDPVADNYTVQKFLDDVNTRYGGVDSILMWPTYTNIGTDARSQYDLFSAMPGGLPGVRAAVDQLHAAGVKVLLPYNPWDTGTRRGKKGGPFDPLPPSPPVPPSPPSTSCYRRTDVKIQKCAHPSAGWDTYTEDAPPGSGVWTKHENTNCYGGGHGGAVVYPEPFSHSLPIADCQQACQSDKQCTAITVAQGGNPGGEVTDDVLLDGLIKAVNADGFNGDTMGSVPEAFWTTSVKIGHPIAIEPEGGGRASDGNGNWDTMGWGYWGYPKLMSVDSWKWLDPRRLTNICERWSKDHTNALQYALFNGDGFESWENVWGTWNGITARDGEQIRRVGSILRFLGGRGYLQSQGWVPHSPTAVPGTLFASMWPMVDDKAPVIDSVAWTVVNRDQQNPHSGAAINVTAGPAAGVTWNYYDLWFGEKIAAPTNGQIPLSMEANGYGAVLATSKTTDTDPELAAFLAKMKAMQAKGGPIQKLNSTWTYELQTRVPIAAAPVAAIPDGMVKVAGGAYRFAVKGIEIEGAGSNIQNNPFGVDFQYEWESVPNRFHDHTLTMKAFYMDKNLVTQGEFAAYLRATPSAMPADVWHYLGQGTGDIGRGSWDWTAGATSIPKPYPGNETLPVTYIGLDEARAYCKAAGKRLPRDEEWQYAGQGTGTTSYTRPTPWGDAGGMGVHFPQQQSGQVIPGPEPVGKYSPGDLSPFGVADMLGNVWQYTDEFQDSHTRSVCVRGGSNYRPAGSMWYFPNEADLLTHNKYFLMNPRYERAGTIGFRCVADPQ